ncbi:hypothetical protein Ctha_1037 [Chloroherpeton thalassium ATCC 35110]|uniref:Uncharacterized protein n=1 Tax=Chloroherpeton thalassium (strain ATCC 35110 / GB-78) TaxID=517418 RepID=B3QXX3_CHLT3|nr:MBL fold metallo-hydrolase [Chloroherpeton thalassium]ACF13501.1 hypothetical protein Ctha_1037 [Chloroherpeton thalassium ATCC 35110]
MKSVEKLRTKTPKRIAHNFYSLGNGVFRVSGPAGALCAYLVDTSAGLIQINTVPELLKTFFPHLQKLPVAICVTAPAVNQIGDTQTGFEFELWVSRFIDYQSPHRIKFIGHEAFLKTLYERLKITMNGDFVADEQGVKQAKFIQRRWVDDVFEWKPTDSTTQIGNVTIDMSDPTGVKIYDKTHLIFDSGLYPTMASDDLANLYVEALLSQVHHATYDPEILSLTVGGTGIGTRPGVTSNFILYYGNRVIWIDPPAMPFEKSVKLQVHPDLVTDHMITHCHEDHIEGFSAVLQRKIQRSEVLTLLSTTPIYEQLKAIFNPLFGDISQHISFLDLSDRNTFSSYYGCNIEIRDNYHPVPTIGLRLTYNGRQLSISGDVLYRKQIIDARLKNGDIDKATYEKLSPEWFAESEILLHDTTVAKDPVHTELEDLEQLAQELPNVKVYSYHFGTTFDSHYTIPAKEGQRL